MIIARSQTAGELLASVGDRAALAELADPRLTQPQRLFCSSGASKLLWRGGNSIGKSYGHAWDLVHYTRGTHPFRPTPRGPRKVMVAGFSFGQMDPLMEKLWKLLPKGEIDPKLYYSPGNGIRGHKEPTITFTSGPGAGSVIYLATYEQGAQRIMGFQGHRLSLDEPPPESIYSEAVPRLNFYGGEMRITMTPTPESPPLEYMKALVEDGVISELQTDYCQEACTVLGGLVPWAWKTEREIEADIAQYLEDEREMRRSGAWEPAVSGRWLSELGDACLRDSVPLEGTWWLSVCTDHGTRPGRQYTGLVAMSPHEEVVLLDEVASDEVTSSDDDARGIIAMLQRNGLRWDQIDLWVGDRATSDSYWGSAKSNGDLLAALARHLRVSQRQLASEGLRIQTAFKTRSSVRRGVAYLNGRARVGKLLVAKRCRRFWESVTRWKGGKADPLKDPVDAVRYGVLGLRDQYDRELVHT